jgi:hypothetical protein
MKAKHTERSKASQRSQVADSYALGEFEPLKRGQARQGSQVAELPAIAEVEFFERSQANQRRQAAELATAEVELAERS